MHTKNPREFESYIREFAGWNVEPRDGKAHREAFDAACRLGQSKLVEMVVVRKPGKHLFLLGKLKGSEVKGVLVGLAGGLVRSEGDTLAERLAKVEDQIVAAKSVAKKALMAKVLETAIVYSENQEMWRNGMNAFTNIISKRRGGESARISALMLSNICTNEGVAKPKKELAGRVIVKAAFMSGADIGRIAIPAMHHVKGPLALASLIALSGRGRMTPAVSSAVSNLIYDIGFEIGGKEGGKAAMALVAGKEVGTEGDAQKSAFEGFRLLFDSDVELPDPLFLPNAGGSGYPVPTLEEGGVHDSSFKVLSRMKTWWAVSAFLSGVAQLVSPHLEIHGGKAVGERAVVRAIPRVEENLSALLALNDVDFTKRFSGLLVGPEFEAISRVDPFEARGMSAGSCAFLKEAIDLDVAGFALPRRAEELLKQGASHRITGIGDDVARNIATNIVVMADSYWRLAGRGGIQLDKEKAIKFVSRVVMRGVQGREQRMLLKGRRK